MKVSINYTNKQNCDGINIPNINWSTVKTNELILKINSISSKSLLKKYIKRIIKYRKWLNIKEKVELNIYNYNDDNLLIVNFANLVAAIIESENLKDLYNRVYILACDYLDLHFYSKNVCDFCNDKCGGKKTTTSVIGCCRHLDKRFGALIPR